MLNHNSKAKEKGRIARPLMSHHIKTTVSVTDRGEMKENKLKV